MSHSSRESDPLLGHPNGVSNGDHRSSFFQRTIHVIKADGEPTWIESYRHFFFGSWLNLFLLFVPLSFASHWSHWDAALRFSFSFVAIIPLAKVSLEPYVLLRYLNLNTRHVFTSYSEMQPNSSHCNSVRLSLVSSTHPSETPSRLLLV